MKTVLFVCEHGSAKSVVAAAHFNKAARERNLPYHAIARGTDPDAVNYPGAVAGLEADGLQPGGEPTLLSARDLGGAAKVIAFGELSAEQAGEATVEVWRVPPVSENYDVARNEIAERVASVIAALSSEA